MCVLCAPLESESTKADGNARLCDRRRVKPTSVKLYFSDSQCKLNASKLTISKLPFSEKINEIGSEFDVIRNYFQTNSSPDFMEAKLKRFYRRRFKPNSVKALLLDLQCKSNASKSTISKLSFSEKINEIGLELGFGALLFSSVQQCIG